MAIDLALSNRSRRYGYIYWRKKDDQSVRSLLGSSQELQLILNGHPLGRKRVDWKNRRISLGWKQTRNLDKTMKVLRLLIDRDGSLSVRCL